MFVVRGALRKLHIQEWLVKIVSQCTEMLNVVFEC